MENLISKKLKNKYTSSVLMISFLVSIMSLFSALLGFFYKNLYENVILTGVFKTTFVPGTISQDIIAIASSFIMFILILLYLKTEDNRLLISIIGLLSFYFYGYGIFVISAIFTSIYLVYMAIFSLSILGMIIGICGFTDEYIKSLFLPKWIRICGIAFLSMIVLIFMSIWIIDLIPYTKNHTVPEFYAVYILDLCFILPLFIVIIYMLIKNIKRAYVFLGIALLKTGTLILSVVIGCFVAPLYGVQEDISMIFIYSSIVIIGFVLYAFYFKKIKHQIE